MRANPACLLAARSVVSSPVLGSKRLSGLGRSVYVDHAGATLYAESQLQESMQDMAANLYGNPHSQSDSASRAASLMEEMRAEVLVFCKAPQSEYVCVFTAGASAALKLVGETFPWSRGSTFLYQLESHNSVLGIREYALASGASAAAVDLVRHGDAPAEAAMQGSALPLQLRPRRPLRRNQAEASGTSRQTESSLSTQCCCSGSYRATTSADADSEEVVGEAWHLLALSAECNFSGERNDPSLIEELRLGRGLLTPRERTLVLLDAAKACSTGPPDLSKCPIDFVAISFYKASYIFGYPTGLGALLVRRDAADCLQKKYFGGGTVALAISDLDVVRRREAVEAWLEDGTTSFLSIAALKHGFAAITRLGMPAIGRHTGVLTMYLGSKLAALRHGNRKPVCVLYGSHDFQGDVDSLTKRQGPIVTFNILRADGSWVGHREVEKLAVLHGIHLRVLLNLGHMLTCPCLIAYFCSALLQIAITACLQQTGCFCNPGACAKYLKLSHENLLAHYEAGHICWDDNDIIDGKPTGAVRVSFGYMSSYSDAAAVINFVKECFVEGDMELARTCQRLRAQIPPAALKWSKMGPLDDQGAVGGNELRLQAIFVYPVKSCAGIPVESWPLGDRGLQYDREWMVVNPAGQALTQKKPKLDLTARELVLRAPHMHTGVRVPLQASLSSHKAVHVCSDRVEATDCGDEAASWLSKALRTECRLVYQGVHQRYIFGRQGEAGSPTPMRHKPLEEAPTDTSSTGLAVERDRDRGPGPALSFANEGQLLLITAASLEDLGSRVRAASAASQEPCCESTGEMKGTSSTSPADTPTTVQFRPNLVVSGGCPYAEDKWREVFIGSHRFQVLGACNRCQMINVNQSSGRPSVTREPLHTLSSYRRHKGRIDFGILLCQAMEANLAPSTLSPLSARPLPNLANRSSWRHGHEEVLAVGQECVTVSC
eukprot:SM000123S25842  [mRNA]  locus=s123:199195:205729:+ [translate_table: standard]